MEAESGSRGGAVLVPSVPAFLTKCYDMAEDPSTNQMVSWSENNNSFVIWDPHAFARDLLPKHFKHNNLSSFVRQLNTYGFRKVDPDRLEFANEGFLRGQKHLLKNITRKKPIQSIFPTPQFQGRKAFANTFVEVGKFGAQEEIERLRRDRNILMQELVKLRQHQQSTDHQLQELRELVQGMEEKQQQMLSFLAMAFQSPNFLSHLVQQNGNNRWRNETNKKRRLPVLGQGVMDGLLSSDGQIVKFQPYVTESAGPCLTSAVNANISSNLETSSDGVSDLCANVDIMSLGAKQSLPTEGALLPSHLDYLEKLLFSPVAENNGDDEFTMEFPDLSSEFDLPAQENQMEAFHNVVPPKEQKQAPEELDKK